MSIEFSVFERDGFVLRVNVQDTTEYYQKNSICDCPGCRNFYPQIAGKCPELAAFLSQMGVDISRPDETFYWDIDQQIAYYPNYTAIGSLEPGNEYDIVLDGHQVKISKGNTPFLHIPNEQTQPYIVIAVSDIRFPWVLDEPSIIEPEREPILQRIKRRMKLAQKRQD